MTTERRPTDGRSKRVTAILAVSTVVWVLLVIVALSSIADMLAPVTPLPAGIDRAIVGIPVALVGYFGFRQLVLRRPPEAYRLGGPSPLLLAWGAFGVVLPAVVLGAHLLLQDVVLVGATRDPWLAVTYAAESVAMGLLAGIVEELPFRGYLLGLVERRWGSTAAVVSTSILFAVLHQGHAPSPTTFVLIVASMFLAGVLLSVVVLRSGNVWNAVLVHTGWNAVIGGKIVTLAPPGAEAGVAILSFRIESGGVLLAGGAAAVSASPITMALLCLVIWALAPRIAPGRRVRRVIATLV